MPVSRSIALLAALAVTLAVTGTASASVKPFKVVLSPASVPAGAQAVLAVTITNGSGNQQLGSVDLTAPAAFTVRTAALPGTGPGAAAVSGRVVSLRDLSLPPGGVVRLDVGVDAGCSAGEYGWSAVAKQANQFNGPPGNDFVLAAGSSLTTTVAGACALRFATQPQDARVGERLSGADFDPTGPPVSVEVIDGSGQRAASSTAAVSVGFATTGGLGNLSGTTTATAVAGLATFGDLRVDAAGTYRLLATAPGVVPAVSAGFTIAQFAVACVENVDCSGSLATPDSRVETTALANPLVDAGFLQLSLGAGFRPDCAGYTEFSADWATIVGPDRQKLVVFTVDKRVMNARPNNGSSFLQMCFAAPFAFATRTGAPPAEVDVDGDAITDWRVGLLPDCGPPPCVSGRHKTNAGDGVIDVRAPGGAEDPAYRP